ncbi:MAG TPA: hypothetical protein VK507_25605 [Iamia sp.]|nr:hypothetical protein [Iamia sp.]
MTDLNDQIRAWVDAAEAEVAPVTVDEARERADAGTGDRRWHPGIRLAAAIVAVVGIATGSVLLLPRDGDGERTTTDRPDRAEVSFIVLGVTEESSTASWELQAASSPDGLDALWSGAGLDGPVPAVDFGTHAVVGITFDDDLCAPTLVRFDRDGVELTPVFRGPPGFCHQVVIARTFVVALDLATTGTSFRLARPERSVEGEADLVLDVDRPGPTGAGMPVVWPLGATDADRSSPKAAARSFVASAMGSAVAERAEVVAEPDVAPGELVAVDVGIDATRSQVLTAPTADGWVIVQAGDGSVPVSADPPRAQIAPVDGAITVTVRTVTDLGAAVSVGRTTLAPSLVDLPPGTVRSIIVIHRALDGRVLAFDAGSF